MYLQKFKKYVTKTWIEQRIDVLSVYGQAHRTNNSCESLNARWNAKVGTKHPNFWVLSEYIWEDFEDTIADMKRVDRGLEIRRAAKV